jgi:uncharacterized protein YfiM (DUF2279 family)
MSQMVFAQRMENLFSKNALYEHQKEFITITDKSSDRDDWIAPDKAKHFMAGMFIEMNSELFLKKSLHKSNRQAKTSAIIFTSLLSIGKEWLDKRQPNNHFCWKDLTMDVAGIITGIIWIHNL